MSSTCFAEQRLANQQISRSAAKSVLDVVQSMGAMQAQDFASSLWAVGVRLPGSTEADVRNALARGDIVRTWPMRGTLHLVPARDAKWMLNLMTSRVISSSASRHRQLELDGPTLTQGHSILERALIGGQQLTRAELYAEFETYGISPEGQRGIHILGHAAMSGLICHGAYRGKQPTFTLLDEWVPDSVNLEHDGALATLATRYFTSHGPATAHDFAWWTGLTLFDARKAIELTGDSLRSETVDGAVYWTGSDSVQSGNIDRSGYLLAPFDEFLLGYRDRSAVLENRHAHLVVPGKNGVFKPVIVQDAQIIGTWTKSIVKSTVQIVQQPFPDSEPVDPELLKSAIDRYTTFLGQSPAEVSGRRLSGQVAN